MKTTINIKQAPQAIGPYSQAVIVDKFIFFSGQLPINPISGKIESTTIEEQTKQIMQNIKSILESQNLGFSNLVKTTVFLTDLTEFKKFNDVYASFFSDAFPARSTVQVSALPLNSKIEIEGIATIEL